MEQDPKKDAIPIAGKETDEFVKLLGNSNHFAKVRMETTKENGDLSSNIAL